MQMSPEDHARVDLLSHYSVLIDRARDLAGRLRCELDITDDEAEVEVVQARLCEIDRIITANEAKAALVRSKLGEHIG